jgi:hypothetical protein
MASSIGVQMGRWAEIAVALWSLVVACGGETRSDDTQSFLRDAGAVGTGGSVAADGRTGGSPAVETGGASASSGGTGGSCGAGLVSCGAFCANLQSDPVNCGGCDRQCCPGSMCYQGACVVGCPAGMILCGESSVEPECTATCADLATNSSHCGQCNHPCLGGGVCVGGQCTGGITEADLPLCLFTSDCIVVPYSHCCGATKRAINATYLSAYESHPEWQVFADPSVCAVIGVCPDDSAVTSATCADGLCALVYP